MASTTLQAPAAVSGPTPAAGYRPANFADAVLSEWTKIRTLRSTFFTLAATVVFVVGLGALISYEGSVHYTAQDGLWDPTSISLSGLVIGQLTIAVLGVLAITGEYSTGMVRTSLAAVPRRGRLLAAKAVVFGAVAVLSGRTGELGGVLSRPTHDQRPPAHGFPQPTRRSPGRRRRRAVHSPYRAHGRRRRHHPAVHRGSHHRGDRRAVRAPRGARGPAYLLAAAGGEVLAHAAGEQILQVTRDSNTLPAWLGFGELALFVAVLFGLGYFLLQRRDAGGK